MAAEEADLDNPCIYFRQTSLLEDLGRWDSNLNFIDKKIREIKGSRLKWLDSRHFL